MTATIVAPLDDVKTIAAGLRRAHSTAGARIDKAIVMVANGGVEPLGLEGWSVKSGSDPDVSYCVVLQPRPYCECRDFERGFTCKHVFASAIYAQLQARRQRNEALEKARRGNAIYCELFGVES